MKRARDFTYPEQNEIDKIILLLEKIRDLLADFVSEWLHRLTYSGIPSTSNELSRFAENYVLAIKQHIYDSIGYINAHRYDPSFKDAIRSIGFFGSNIKAIAITFYRINGEWIKVKSGPYKIERQIYVG